MQKGAERAFQKNKVKKLLTINQIFRPKPENLFEAGYGFRFRFVHVEQR